MVKHKQKRQRIVRLSAGMTLASLGLFNLALPVLALGTRAGTNISNTATATFDDPTGNKTTTSNTVDITIAEVAGLTNVAQLPIDTNGGSVVTGDTVQFPFDIRNTGNDPTDIFIPTPANVTVDNLDTPILLVDVDGDGNTDYTIDNAGAITPIGAPTIALTASGGGFVLSSINPDTAITVTVQGTVPSVPSGTNITAQLGNTNSNDAANPDSQNQPDDGTAPDTAQGLDEVRTIDNNAADGNTTAPVNGEREAADTSQPLVVDTVASSPLAVATVGKTSTGVSDGGTTGTVAPLTNFNDDIITYGLTLDVAVDVPTSVAGDFVAADLVGTPIALDGNPADTRILISDVIPAQTVLATADPVAPAGWIPVYSETPATAATDDALAATWTTTRPVTAANITRVGFVNDTATITSVPVNTSVTGFTLSVVTQNIVADVGDVDGDGDVTEPTPIFNIAQVLGQTDGDANNNIVFDESGDSNPNNFNDDGTQPIDNNGNTNDDPYGDFNPNTDNGNPGTPPDSDADTGNNNTGTGTDGEPNKVELTPNSVTPVPGNLVNGPLDNADATGIINDNDDFTNSAIVDGISQGVTTIDPSPTAFDNSVRNISGIALDNVVIRPISVADANTVCAACTYVDTALPDGTQITIAEDLNNDGVFEIAIYDVTGGNVVLNTTAGLYTAPRDVNGDGVDDNVAAYDDPAIGGTINSLVIDTLAVGQEVDYNVVVDLPANTQTFNAFSVPVAAFVDNNDNDTFEPTNELTNNVTIDRLYTGFLRLTKSAQILYADGSSSVPFGVVNGADVAAPTRLPGPGDRIRYEVTYENISAASAGTGSAVLSAQNLIITESGFSADTNNNGVVDGVDASASGQADDSALPAVVGGNNWALDQDFNGEIDTSNVTGTAVVGGSNTGSIQFFSGNPAAAGSDVTGTTANSDVTQYVNTVGTVNPGETGTFSFQRLIN